MSPKAASLESLGSVESNQGGQHAQRPLDGSPLALVVHPAAPSADASLCTATPTQCQMLAGEDRSFTVRTLDSYGNACDAGGASIALHGVPVVRGDVAHRVADLGSGTYTLTWTSCVAGVHDVEVHLDGRPMSVGRSSHLKLLVEPNTLCVATCSVSGDGLGHATAGERAMIYIHCKDACGNALKPCAGMQFGISLWDKRRVQSARPVQYTSPHYPLTHLPTYPSTHLPTYLLI